MIPICLVTGFLGSGKTTLLGELARTPEGAASVFVVNEFAKTDVDGRLVGDAVPVISIPGGSIFCTCLVTRFVEHLKALAEKHAKTPYEGVVIEASGIANPSVIERLLSETELDQTFVLRRVIAVAEPITLPKVLQTLPNARQQLEAADLILLNKTDLVQEDVATAMLDTLREINADAEIRMTRRCAPVSGADLYAGPHHTRADGDYATCADPNFTVLRLELTNAPSRDALSERIRAFPGELYRAKGWVTCAEGPTFIDLASGQITTEAVSDATALTGLVLMAGGDMETELREHFACFTSPLAIAAKGEAK